MACTDLPDVVDVLQQRITELEAKIAKLKDENK